MLSKNGKCLGPRAKGCPKKNNSGPAGGICPVCVKVRNKLNMRDWYVAQKKGNRRDIKKPGRPSSAERLKEALQARSVDDQGVGIKGAISVVNAMLRAAL